MKVYEYINNYTSDKVEIKTFDAKETEKSYVTENRRFSKQRLDTISYDERGIVMYSLKRDKETYNHFLDYIIDKHITKLNYEGMMINNLKKQKL